MTTRSPSSDPSVIGPVPTSCVSKVCAQPSRSAATASVTIFKLEAGIISLLALTAYRVSLASNERTRTPQNVRSSAGRARIASMSCWRLRTVEWAWRIGTVATRAVANVANKEAIRTWRLFRKLIQCLAGFVELGRVDFGGARLSGTCGVDVVVDLTEGNTLLLFPLVEFRHDRQGGGIEARLCRGVDK